MNKLRSLLWFWFYIHMQEEKVKVNLKRLLLDAGLGKHQDIVLYLLVVIYIFKTTKSGDVWHTLNSVAWNCSGSMGWFCHLNLSVFYQLQSVNERGHYNHTRADGDNLSLNSQKLKVKGLHCCHLCGCWQLLLNPGPLLKIGVHISC